MELEKLNYFNDGYCLIKKNFFSASEALRIEEILDKLAEGHNPNVEIDTNVMGGKSLALQNFIDENFELKNYINKIFTNKEIVSKIENNLGKNFKITEIVYRKSYPGDKGLDIHQDADGENTIIVNLSGNEDYNGKTCFVKSSHQESSIKKIINRQSITFKLNKILKFFLDFMDFSSGSILLFNNKVWHGRFANQSKSSSSALIIGVYKEGSIVNYNRKIGYKEIMNKLDLKNYELDLRRNLSDNLVERKTINSYYLIPSNNKKNNKEILIKNRNLKTIIFIFLIKFLYSFKRA
jgi:non-heme Fe2+,alpha-ketoglutarate-dependent halogenase